VKTIRGLQPPRPETRRPHGAAPGPETSAPEPMIVEAPRFSPVESLVRRPLFFC
jgi:hypothetical protein